MWTTSFRRTPSYTSTVAAIRSSILDKGHLRLDRRGTKQVSTLSDQYRALFDEISELERKLEAAATLGFEIDYEAVEPGTTLSGSPPADVCILSGDW